MWTLMESDGNWTNGKHRATYLLDTAGDISTPPEEDDQLSAGSVAYTADLGSIWLKDSNGNWVSTN